MVVPLDAKWNDIGAWLALYDIGTKDNQGNVLKGESTYIPLGVIHAVENQTKEKLEIIEVQSGSYLGEDDIVRFEDIYGRAEE